MAERDLSNSIAELFSSVGVVQDRLDTDITLDKMSDDQRNDLAAMIDFLRPTDNPSHILGQVAHDLCGLKAGFLGLPEGECFLPRSSGYADMVA